MSFLIYEDRPFTLRSNYLLTAYFEDDSAVLEGSVTGVWAVVTPDAAAGDRPPGIGLPVFLTPTAPPLLPVVRVHWPVTLRPNMSLQPRQLSTCLSRAMS